MESTHLSNGREATAYDERAWATLTAFGLLLVGITLLLSSAHLVVVGAFAGPVVVLPVIGTVCAVTGALARGGSRRALVAALVVSVLVLLGNLGHLVDTLRLPGSPWDFVPNLAAGIGIVVALAAAVAGLRRAPTTAAATRRVQVAALVVIGLGTVTSIGLALVSTASLPADAVVVTTADNAYSPAAVEVAPGDVIGVRNRDGYGHTFTVDDLGLDVGVPGGSAATVPIDAGVSAGTYEVTCVLHPGIMVATLIVAAQ